MNISGLKSRRLWVLLFIGIPCLLLMPLLKIAHERPHFFKAEDMDVEEILFSKDEKTVLLYVVTPDPMDSDYYDWCDLHTSKTPPPSQINQAWTSTPYKYGSLSIQYEIDGDVTYHDGPSCSASKNCFKAKIGYSSDGQSLTLASREEIIRWDRRQGKCLSKIVLQQPADNDSSQDIGALSPDGTVCALRKIYKSQSRYELLDCQSGKVIAQIPPRQSPEYPQCFFTSDSHTIVVWTSGQAEFFDVRTTKRLWTLKFSSPLENAAAYVNPRPTSNGLVGMPSKDGFDFYAPRTGNVTRHLNHPALSEMESWNFSPDGKQLWWSTPEHQIFWRDLD